MTGVTANFTDDSATTRLEGTITGDFVTPVGVVLEMTTTIDISGAGGVHIPTWDRMRDNTYDANVIPFAFPDALGIAYDPVEQAYTILEDGLWWWDLSVKFPVDASISLDLEPCFFGANAETVYGPGLGEGRNSQTWVHWGAAVRFPAGATPNPVIRTFAAAAVSPLAAIPSATIERIR
jgi:hypothetical protein